MEKLSQNGFQICTRSAAAVNRQSVVGVGEFSDDVGHNLRLPAEAGLGAAVPVTHVAKNDITDVV